MLEVTKKPFTKNIREVRYIGPTKKFINLERNHRCCPLLIFESCDKLGNNLEEDLKPELKTIDGDSLIMPVK